MDVCTAACAYRIGFNRLLLCQLTVVMVIDHYLTRQLTQQVEVSASIGVKGKVTGSGTWGSLYFGHTALLYHRLSLKGSLLHLEPVKLIAPQVGGKKRKPVR